MRKWNLYADSGVLGKAGCIVGAHAFKAGHQLGLPSVEVEALRWLIGEDDKPRLP
jgi:hypothetical protein